MKTPHIKDLMNFLDTSPTSFQAALNIENILLEKGFVKLDETQPWKLTAGKKYFVVREQSAVAAFVIGKKKPHLTGIKIAGSHLDSPALKIKPDGIRTDKNYTKLTVEVYGSPIISTWLDRELSIAGRIMIKTGSGKSNSFYQVKSLPVDLKKPVAIIPNAAIHMNRDINKGFEYNAQNHLPAILQAMPKDGKAKTLTELVASAAKIKANDIMGMDLFLYDPCPATCIGAENEILVSGRLDNLAMTHAILTSLMDSVVTDTTQMAVFFDHEEIGSTTMQGADSTFLADILNRFGWALQLDIEQITIAMRKSFIVSADMAHAVHPNFMEKHDPAYMPLMNHGPVIKINSSQRYATTAESCVIFEQICQETKVPVQKIINRSDLPSGSTIGPVTSARLGIKTVDIGNPMWAMHSIRESMGVYDHEYLIKALTHFYQN